MRPVRIQKRKYNWKDLRQFFILGLGHYLLMVIYTAIVFGIHFAMFNIFIDFSTKTWLIIYPLIIGPLVNLTLHVWFSEQGKPYLRLAMWLNTLFMFILVIAVEF